MDLSAVADNFLPGQTQSFADMFNTYFGYRRMRQGEEPSLSIEQMQLLEFDRMMRDYAKYFSPNRESSDDYYKLKDLAYSALDSTGKQSELARGVSWWFDKVNSPYYDKLDKLYEKLDATNDRDKPLVYQEIRNLADRYSRAWVNDKHPEWGEFPSPEEYVFAKLSPKDQELQIGQWAALPAHFLTEFQREQVGYDIPEGRQKEASELANYITTERYDLKKWAAQNDIYPSSTAYADREAKMEKGFADRAEELGLDAYWKQMNRPTYERVGEALNLDARSPLWTWAAEQAANLRAQIEAEDYSPGGTSDIAKRAHTWLANNIEKVRGRHPEFDALLTELQDLMGEEGQPLTSDDLVLKLFFDVYDTGGAFYLDKKE